MEIDNHCSNYVYISAGGDTANAIYRRFISPQGGNIGITAHIGGLLAGRYQSVFEINLSIYLCDSYSEESQ